MAYTILRTILRIIVNPWIGKWKGIENVPKKGGFIIAPNHSSYLDHIMVGLYVIGSLKRRLRTLAKKEHFDNPIEAMWHRYIGAIPLDREAGGGSALREAVLELNKGEIIMIYPEGTRTLTGKMNRAKTGVARLALGAKVPVVPIGVTNTFKIMPKGQHIPKGKWKANVNVGKPMYFEKYYGKDDCKKTLRKITTLIMNEIASLANTKYEFDKELK